MKGLRRFDTLFLRLFILMWVTLVLSHAAAFFTVMLWNGQLSNSLPIQSLRIPTFPSLPPGNPFSLSDDGDQRPGPPGNQADRPHRQGHPPGATPYGQGQGPDGRDVPNHGADGPPNFGDAPDGDGRRAMPLGLLRLDYAVRIVVMALGAVVAATWLAAPMRRLSAATSTLSEGFSRGVAPPTIDEAKGTIEMRSAARAFNQMARRLQEQFDARGMQMASVSHDLRTPLARLRLRLERIANEDVAQKAIADIHEMDEMIHETLAVLREQQDGSGPSVVDITSLLQSMADDFTDQGDDVSFENPIPARVRARPAALKRVIGNVLCNAIRYAGQAVIRITAGPDLIQVVIDDSGPGIPEAELSRAFEPWVRLGELEDAPHARSGHGLGLAIARDLVRRDGGELTLSNREGGGLRATLELPPA